MQDKQRIFWKVAAVGWGIIFTILLLIPPPDLGGESFIPHKDKVMHLGVFGLWIVLMLMAEQSYNHRKKYFLIGLIGCIYAPITELLQSLTPDRTADLWDVMADVSGVLLAIAMFHWLYPKVFLRKGQGSSFLIN